MGGTLSWAHGNGKGLEPPQHRPARAYGMTETSANDIAMVRSSICEYEPSSRRGTAKTDRHPHDGHLRENSWEIPRPSYFLGASSTRVQVSKPLEPHPMF